MLPTSIITQAWRQLHVSMVPTKLDSSSKSNIHVYTTCMCSTIKIHAHFRLMSNLKLCIHN